MARETVAWVVAVGEESGILLSSSGSVRAGYGTSARGLMAIEETVVVALAIDGCCHLVGQQIAF